MRTILLLLGVLLLPSTANADELTRPAVVFSAAAAADWITTYRALSSYDLCVGSPARYCAGAVHERNPFLRPFDGNTAVLIGVAAATDMAGVLIARKIGKRHPKLIKVVFYSAAALRVAQAARNEILLQRAQTRAAALNAIYQ